MSHPVISADSHVTEPPEAWRDIDPKFRDRAPRVQHIEGTGDIYVIEGLKVPIPLGIVAAAGKPAEEIRLMGTRFEDLHRGGWDPASRIADQDRDGVAAEVIYPTVGMAVCNHRDADYKQACMDAYNRWLAGYCAPSPHRLLGVGQTPMRSPAAGIRDLEAIKALGLRGAMMPGNPVVEDYDSPVYDEFWDAAIELGLPLSFHILTTRDTTPTRGPRMNAFLSVIRGCQEIMGMLVLGGVFERHPKLRVVCVEADAGWVPHYMYRMDHAWKRHATGSRPARRSRACRRNGSPSASTQRSRTTGSPSAASTCSTGTASCGPTTSRTATRRGRGRRRCSRSTARSSPRRSAAPSCARTSPSCTASTSTSSSSALRWTSAS